MPTNRRLAPIFTKERARQDRAIARRNRILELKTRERNLITEAKDARARGQTVRFNDLKLRLVRVRELVRQAGGKPEVRPLAKGKTTRYSAKPQRGGGGGAGGGSPASRPNGQGGGDEEVYAPIPDDDNEMPGDVDEASGDDWLEEAFADRRGYTDVSGGGYAAQAALKAKQGKGGGSVAVDASASAGAAAKKGIFDFLKPDPAKVAARKKAAAERAAAAKKRPGLFARRKPAITKLGEHMAITTRPGFRAAVTEFKPGLYVIAEVPEGAVVGKAGFGDETGFLPLLAPLVVTAVAQEAGKRQAAQRARAQQQRQVAAKPAPQQLTGPTDPNFVAGALGLDGEDVPRWLSGEVAAEVLGCDGRPCNCGR